MSQYYGIELTEEEAARYAGSKHVGMIGERSDFMGLKVFMRKEKETDNGMITILGFEDRDGNVLIWFATGAKGYGTGQTVDLKATIKGYDETNGIRKTIISRAVETAEKKVWRARAVGARAR